MILIPMGASVASAEPSVYIVPDKETREHIDTVASFAIRQGQEGVAILYGAIDTAQNGSQMVYVMGSDTAWNATTFILDHYPLIKEMVFQDEDNSVTEAADWTVSLFPDRPNCINPFITSLQIDAIPPLAIEYNSPCYEPYWDKVGFDPIMIVWIIIIDLLNG